MSELKSLEHYSKLHPQTPKKREEKRRQRPLFWNIAVCVIQTSKKAKMRVVIIQWSLVQYHIQPNYAKLKCYCW
jgi:hypothetical protein